MPTAVWILLLVFYLNIALRWLLGHLELTRQIRTSLVSPSSEEPSGVPVTVIIAAHNEADAIRPCLEKILAQRYPSFNVIVANDRSTDETGVIVAELAREHGNLRCVDVTDLPDGWLGKTHAVSVAAGHADGAYLVFTDSDVDWHPDTLATVMDRVERERLDFFTLWPRVRLVTFWERFLLPACGWALNFWFTQGWPRNPRTTPVFANGQFILVRCEAYEAMGGHAAVADEMTEDIALARRARDEGLRRGVGLGPELIQTRMYENLSQIVSGWTRIFIGGLGSRRRLVTTVVAAVLAGVSLPIVVAGLIVAASLGAAGSMLFWAWVAAAILHAVGIYTLMPRIFAYGFEGGTCLALFPFALGAVSILLLHCVRILGGTGRIRWGNVWYQVQGTRAVRSEQVGG